MDNQQFQPVQNQSIWIIILPTIIITALIVGGGVWWWQKSAFEKEKEDLQQQIDELKSQISGQEVSEQEKSGNQTSLSDQCWNFDSQLPGDSVLEIEITIDKKDKVSVDADIISGFTSLVSSKEDNSEKKYSYKVLDKDGNILYKKYFLPDFFIYSDPPTPTNISLEYNKIKYSSLMYEVKVFREDTLLASRIIENVCNCDYKCDSGEAPWNCPVDCKSWLFGSLAGEFVKATDTARLIFKTCDNKEFLVGFEEADEIIKESEQFVGKGVYELERALIERRSIDGLDNLTSWDKVAESKCP